jgi:1-acyl-sn-glycerol-3-phosphate acyltransferase
MAAGTESRPGSAAPDRRLPVDPGAARSAVAYAKRRLRVPHAFPLAPPTWPGSVALPPVERTLGIDYDSSWARSPAARLGRSLMTDLVARPVVKVLASPRVHGLDRISHLDEPVIFAANHASHVDAPLLVSVIPERWRSEIFVAGAADYFFDTRPKAIAFSFLINAVPIERQRVSRDSANRVAELLSDGWSMLIFPEGGRSPDGWGQRHRAGAAWLAVRTGRPLVPVHLSGTRAVIAKGSRRIRRARTDVSFGIPIPVGERDDPRVLTGRLEAAVAALADELSTDWYSARRRAASGTTPPLTGPDAGEWRRSWARSGAGRDRRSGQDRLGSRREDRWPR